MARGTGTVTPAPSATSSRTSTPTAGGDGVHPEGEVRLRAGDPGVLPAIGERYDLYTDACFQTEITEMRWDEEDGVWVVSTDRDDRIRARFVAMAMGRSTGPSCPPSPASRRSPAIPSTRAGGTTPTPVATPTGNLTGLAGKRVGVIGTGATAVQCVPHVGAAAEHLYVFQRTPSSIGERNNRPTDPAWAESLEPGWQRRADDELQRPGVGRPAGRGPRGRRLDRHLPQPLGVPAKVPDADRRTWTRRRPSELADFQKMESSGRESTPRCTTRRPPRH